MPEMENRLQAVSDALAPATRTASLLPGATDLDFHSSIDPVFKKSLRRVTEELEALVDQMAAWVDADVTGERAKMDDMLVPARFASTVGETVDRLLEQTDLYLDEYSGRRPLPSTSKGEASGASLAAAAAAAVTQDTFPKGKLPRHILNAQIPRPQDTFTTKPDNSESASWTRPLRLGKPNAQVPLGWKDDAWDVAPDARVEGQYGVEGDARLNPYHYEIHKTPVPSTALEKPQPTEPKPLDLDDPSSSAPCPYVWVDTEAKLRDLKAHLDEERVHEIAIDLEHHSLRSYAGIVCLMQISTRWADWIVDTLVDEVREHAEILNTAFTHPDKVLILHGADHDVLWLQRDLGLYVTNLFDTYQASKQLQLSTLSLAYLLLRYVDFEADKRFQTADWRIRPLPREMLFYARSDTHFLLYVYDRLRCELQTQGGAYSIREVFEKSKATATKVYAKAPWDATGESRSGWRSLWHRLGGDLAQASRDAPPGAPLGREERLVRRLHQWRDQVAREEDESPAYVLPPPSLLSVALRPPETVQEASARVPKTLQHVRSRLAELVHVIKNELTLHRHEAEARANAAGGSMEIADAEDVGQAVVVPASTSTTRAVPAPVPAAVQHGRWLPSDRLPLQTDVWQSVPSSATPTSQLLRGLSTQAAPRKRTSLFEMPSTSKAPPAESTLQRIRTECLHWLHGWLGSSTNEHTPTTEPTWEAHKAQSSPDGAAPAIDDARAPSRKDGDDYDDGDGDDDDQETDRIVQVKKQAKAPRPPAQGKRKHPTPDAFDFENATSVLDAPRTSVAKSLLRASSSSQSRAHMMGPSTKKAKRKSDARSGNRSGTFASSSSSHRHTK